MKALAASLWHIACIANLFDIFHVEEQHSCTVIEEATAVQHRAFHEKKNWGDKQRFLKSL